MIFIAYLISSKSINVLIVLISFDCDRCAISKSEISGLTEPGVEGTKTRFLTVFLRSSQRESELV